MQEPCNEPIWIHIEKERCVTGRWSGGTTTQLAIYPESADYAAQDYSWRISTATIETESSVFTPLPGFSRILTVLEGELELEHEGRHRSALQPFRQDRFEGGWRTASRGLATNFNLIFAEDCLAELVCVDIPPDRESPLNQEFTLQPSQNGEARFSRALYAANGDLLVRIGGESGERRLLKAGEILLATTDRKRPAFPPLRIANRGEGSVKLLDVQIMHPRQRPNSV